MSRLRVGRRGVAALVLLLSALLVLSRLTPMLLLLHFELPHIVIFKLAAPALLLLMLVEVQINVAAQLRKAAQRLNLKVASVDELILLIKLLQLLVQLRVVVIRKVLRLLLPADLHAVLHAVGLI